MDPESEMSASQQVFFPHGRERPAHRLDVRLIARIFVIAVTIFAALTAVDVLSSGFPFGEFKGSAAMARSVGSMISRAYNVLLGMVVSSIALAIPITANMYTPKLVEIFVKDRYTVGVMGFFALSCMHAVWSTFTTWEGPPGGFWAALNMHLILFEMLLGFAIIVPYLHYASGFLNPSIIIERVSGQIVEELHNIEAGRYELKEGQRRLAQTILHFGNVILRAVDRADRDVALEAIGALERVLVHFLPMKARLRPEWFTVGNDILSGLSPDAVDFVNRERNWVEHRCLTQLSLAFNAALAKMPDAVSAISDTLRVFVLVAERHGDRPVVGLTIRFFNTFVREAVKKRDLHAIYDLFTQYRALADGLMGDRPEILAEIGRYFKYYAEFARATAMPFAYELASYDLGDLVRHAYERGVPGRRELLDLMLSLEGAHASPRIAKSRAIAWAHFTQKGLAEEAGKVRASLASVPASVLEAARGEILATRDKMFFEVTDRQTNFDWVDDSKKELIRGLFDGLLRDAAPPPAPRPAPARVA